MSITISVSGIPRIEAAMQQAVQEITTNVDTKVQKAGLSCEGGAKQRAPVRTGRFRAGYEYQKTGIGSCQVTNSVEYGPYLELGTHKMAARPSLVPAFLEAEKNLRDDLNNL